MGTARADTDFAVSLQLENLVGYCGDYLVEHLLSAVSWNDSQRAGGGVSSPFAATCPRKTLGHLGWAQKSSQQAREEFCSDEEETLGAGISSGLRSGTEPGGIHLGLYEAS